MRQSIGYTATLNIVIIFILIIFAFMFGALSYFRAYKVGNSLVYSVEKYEGYNHLSEKEISNKLYGYGYSQVKIDCANTNGSCILINGNDNSVRITDVVNTTGNKGYCVYYCDDGNNYYHYRIATNMFINLPLAGNMFLKVYTNSKSMYDFESAIK